MNDFKWSKTEKKIARAAFEKAYQRECKVQQKSIGGAEHPSRSSKIKVPLP
jgi:hypothetical protein